MTNEEKKDAENEDSADEEAAFMLAEDDDDSEDDRPPLVLDAAGRTSLLTVDDDDEDEKEDKDKETEKDKKDDKDEPVIINSLCHDACRSYPSIAALLLSNTKNDDGEGGQKKKLKLDVEELWERVATDCEHAFTARALGEDEEGKKEEATESKEKATVLPSDPAYSAGETFWIGSCDMPRCGLEALARAIFHLHVRDLGIVPRDLDEDSEDGKEKTTSEKKFHYDPDFSGAEWWTHTIDSSDAIGWHWDRDYSLETGTGLKVYPHAATVTYVRDVGAATVVCSDITGGNGENADKVPPPSKGGNYYVSMPNVGKHLVFDGRYLHGAPTEITDSLTKEEKTDSEKKRVTLMVNVWINHRPYGVSPCSDECVKKMVLSSDDVCGVLCPFIETEEIDIVAAEDNEEEDGKEEKESKEDEKTKKEDEEDLKLVKQTISKPTLYDNIDIPSETEIIEVEVNVQNLDTESEKDKDVQILTWKFKGHDTEEEEDEDGDEKLKEQSTSPTVEHTMTLPLPAKEIKEKMVEKKGQTILVKYV